MLNGCSSNVRFYLAVRKSQNKPSLVRSGGCLFALMCFRLHGGPPDDNRHGKLSDMEGQAHTSHPLSTLKPGLRDGARHLAANTI